MRAFHEVLADLADDVPFPHVKNQNSHNRQDRNYLRFKLFSAAGERRNFSSSEIVSPSDADALLVPRTRRFGEGDIARFDI